MVGVPVIDTGPMTVEEFYAFTDTRPDEEKWELIDGEPILNAAPSRLHQRIVKNVLFALTLREREPSATWEVLPGLGVRVSDTNRPEPDIVILPRAGAPPDLAGRDRSDALVAFEVLSPSTEDRDLRWKRAAYTSLASLTHYVVIAQDAVEVVVFARDKGFAEKRLRSLNDSVEVPALGISLPLAEIYRGTGLARTSGA
jgi:Uma2 family endonuclease